MAIRGSSRLLLVGLTLALTASAEGAVTISISRPELLYSQKADPDCAALHKDTDDQLPFNVARLTATVTGAPAGAAIVYRWSINEKAAGLLAADLDLGPAGQTFAVNGLCAAFGNECILTKGKTKFYNEPTVLFQAPGCDVLPKATERAFGGGTTKIRLKVKAGRRKLGRATATVGWGRQGAVVISAEDTRGVFEDGIGKPNGVNVPAITVLGANVTAHPPSEPPGGVHTFFFDGEGIGSSVEVDGCGLPIPFEACAELDIFNAGHAFPTVEARYMDGSALCDKIEVRTGPCAADPKLELIPRPRLQTYDPDSPSKSNVDFTVRLRNASTPEGGLPACDLLLRGANVLNCMAEAKVGGVEDDRSTTFDLVHCSQTTDRGCRFDADCSPQVCGDCQTGEICLTKSHCSNTLTKDCANDGDCKNTGQPAPCPQCADAETCRRVLDFGSEIVIPAGQSFDLLHETVPMVNELPDTAKIKDTWTAHVFLPKVDATAKLRYQIRGRPKPSPQ